MATLLQFLKETGIRISEALKLKWIDLNTINRTASITPSKGSNPRILSITAKLIVMLEKCNHNTEYIFPRRKGNLRTRFCKLRKRVSERQQNPRLMQISFHTFRHWKGTMEYHKTKDIMHVKYVLGHKAIQSTMVYINLEQATFLTQSTDDEWTCKAAKTIDEATKLIEAGFQYVTTIEGIQLFKKRK
jgi:integrase